MTRAAMLMTFAALVVACPACKRSKGDPVVNVEKDDAEMNAAIAEARQRWPELLAAYREHKGESYAVKYPFPTKNGGNEHIWISVTNIEGDSVTGLIDNEPVNDIGHKNGDSVTVPGKELSDWMYMPPGSKDYVGGFTIKVLLARQKKR